MKFKDDSRIWLESLPTLLQNYHSGSIHAYLKTPQNALVSTASFIHVTTENFETVIFGSEETVVLLVLAPIDYCAQCPALATHFEQLSMTAARQGLVFAMTNAFENEFDEFLLPAFPQIFVFSSPNKEETQGQSISSSSDLDLIINKLIEGQELLSHTDL